MNTTNDGTLSRRLLLAALCLGTLATAHAQRPPWLVGRWELKFDPDGSPKDFLEFDGDGQVVSISPLGRQVSGVYAINEEGVRVSLLLPNGKTFPITLTPTPDKRQLKMKSARTGNISVYEKSKP